MDHMRSEKTRNRKGNPIVTGAIAVVALIVFVAVCILMVQVVTRKPATAGNAAGAAAYLVKSSSEPTTEVSETEEPEEPENEIPTKAKAKPLTEEEIAADKTMAEGLANAKMKLESKFVAVMSMDGSMLFGQQENEKMNPASMTKLMTALLIVENVPDLNTKVQVSQQTMDYTYDEDASNAGFEVGEKASVLDMLYGVLLPSGAECSVTCAEYIAGSHEKFVEMMNDRAKELGMTQTHFTNCAGFYNKNHYSSTKDMAVLLSTCMKSDVIRKIFLEKSHKVEKTNKHKQGFTMYSSVYRKIKNVKLHGVEFLGGKTGYTIEAGQCLASAAKINGKEYILATGSCGIGEDGVAGSAKDMQTVYQQIESMK